MVSASTMAARRPAPPGATLARAGPCGRRGGPARRAPRTRPEGRGPRAFRAARMEPGPRRGRGRSAAAHGGSGRRRRRPPGTSYARRAAVVDYIQFGGMKHGNCHRDTVRGFVHNVHEARMAAGTPPDAPGTAGMASIGGGHMATARVTWRRRLTRLGGGALATRNDEPQHIMTGYTPYRAARGAAVGDTGGGRHSTAT